MSYQSWGRYPKVAQTPLSIHSSNEEIPRVPEGLSILPRGKGRSYGDSCLNEKNFLLLTKYLDRFLEFDLNKGTLRCESGVTLDSILQLIVPHNWFLPVTPGTKFVSMGGAIANDVHGKNHPSAGSFGHHVRKLELLRSDGSRRICSKTENPDLFHATIGGLGLTGLITWAEIDLKKIVSPSIFQESVKFKNIQEFFLLQEQSIKNFEYNVAWMDCATSSKNFGRGVFIRGNHSSQSNHRTPTGRINSHKMYFDMPKFLMNNFFLGLFNFLYYHKQMRKTTQKTSHWNDFFYPLDSLLYSNRLYGREGFIQYQCLLPNHITAAKKFLTVLSNSKVKPYLAVLKMFGQSSPEGLLSFPRPGITFALDFPNTPAAMVLLEHLDKVVLNCNGALYPAKDSRMSHEMFAHSFPRFSLFKQFIDPKISSSFIRRTTE